MQIRPTMMPPRTPAARPLAPAEAARPEAVAQAVAQALPAGPDFADRLIAKVTALVEAVKAMLRPAPPVAEPAPALPVAAPEPQAKPRIAPRPQAPLSQTLHATREDWFFSQYESRTNPNEDVAGNANCGPAALTMIAKAFGKIDPSHADADAAIEESRSRMQASPSETEYTSTSELVEGARTYGLTATSRRMESLEEMRRELGRGKLLIANVVPKYLDESNTGGHFAVVTAIKNGQVHLNDPASKNGPIVVSEAAFKRALDAQGTYAFVSIGR